MSVQKRISLVITGKVQGVGYRYSVKLKAESLSIRVYVRICDSARRDYCSRKFCEMVL